jgi:hypothetical protein
MAGGSVETKFMGDHSAEFINGTKTVKRLLFKNIDKDIVLFDFTESPFMGNITMLIKLNSELEKFENTYLENIINLYSENTKKIIKQKIQEVMYKLLIHTLKILSVASVKIKKDSELSKNIINYSTYICSRIDKWVKDEINCATKSIQKMETSLDMCKEIRLSTNDKIEKNTIAIQEQNTHILNLITQLKAANEARDKDIIDIKQKIETQNTKVVEVPINNNDIIQNIHPQYNLAGGNKETKQTKENNSTSEDLSSMSEKNHKNVIKTTKHETESPIEKKYFKTEEETVDINNIKSESEEIIAI